MKIGLDTGFFLRLLAGAPGAVDPWSGVVDGTHQAFIHCLTLFELRRLGLRGALEPEVAKTLTDELPHVATVTWLDNPDPLERGARLAHGTGLSMADAFILSGFLHERVERVYTTDRDLAGCQAGLSITLL